MVFHKNIAQVLQRNVVAAQVWGHHQAYGFLFSHVTNSSEPQQPMQVDANKKVGPRDDTVVRERVATITRPAKRFTPITYQPRVVACRSNSTRLKIHIGTMKCDADDSIHMLFVPWGSCCLNLHPFIT